MPDMDGLEFAKAVKESENWKDIPMIALTSHATEKDKTKGAEAGFSDYVAKFDRDRLLEVIAKTVAQNNKDAAKALGE